MNDQAIDDAEAAQRAEAKEFLNAVLGKRGWKFVGAHARRGGVIEYEIARISDDRRATVRRTIADITMEALRDEEARRDEMPHTQLPVSLWLAVYLVRRAKEVDAE